MEFNASSPTQEMGNLSLKNKIFVLVVDDNRVNRRIVAMMLAKLGVEVHEAEHGQEAVNIHVAGARYNLILIDMEMPATRILRRMGIQCKIVGVTANSRSSDEKEFMDAGIDEFFPKPMTRAKLVSLLEELEAARAA
ncbi:hypothetical protein ACLOJK_011931 [Asimina triloba]